MELVKNEQQKLYDMMGFLENLKDCRHIALSNYFGEKRKDKIGFCNNLCDNCIRFHKGSLINEATAIAPQPSPSPIAPILSVVVALILMLEWSKSMLVARLDFILSM